VSEPQEGWGSADKTDRRVRQAAFSFLEREKARRGEVLPRKLLAEGFLFEGTRVPLIGPQGIFKPAVLDLPISITTVPVVEGKARPYEDEVGSEGLIKYRYRGTDTQHRDNAGLRRAMQQQVPLIYLYGVVPGEYLPSWPVFVVADDPAALAFHVAVDVAGASWLPPAAMTVAEDRRRYVTTQTQRRLHQEGFRQRVIRAYRERCAICRLHHAELLDAAHILPDGHPGGAPIVPNGLALCKLHHAAFDRNLLGIRPDLVVEIRADVLEEDDGPMLIHGLKGFQLSHIEVPTQARLRPKPEYLEERYAHFRGG